MDKFRFNNKEYDYFYHNYNETWKKERIVEIPVIWEIVQKYQEKDILEVGNVLSHYFSFTHDIVDKCEVAPNVINQDVVEYKPNKKYDLIISISTIEHVGIEIEPKEPYKAQESIEHLKNLLSNNGKLVITIPIGQHEILDKAIIDREILFSKYLLLKRTEYSKWKEIDFNDIDGDTYDKPYGNANELFIGIYTNKGDY